ncbi:MAG TPA: hypothetical protein PKH05_18840, partial [Nitrospira sp.]|nr:hypothetical protein [Nitrospira sp.]
MNKALSTDDFPSILPAWIREWAAACRDGQALHPIYSSSPIRPEETTLLWKILTSVDVGTRLDRVDRTFGDELRPAVQKLLIETCLVYSNSQKRPFGHPSEIKKQIGGIAASARTLADTLHKNILLLDASQNVDYLIERCKTHSPAGFVRGRSGIRRVQPVAAGQPGRDSRSLPL